MYLCKAVIVVLLYKHIMLLMKKGASMAQTMVNFRIDEDLKTSMERACKDMGLTLTAAFTMFATKVARERRIPFEVTADPFYSEANIAHLERVIAELRSEDALLYEHELSEI